MEKQTRGCQNCKAPFEIDASDLAFYEKIKVPPPTWCPECRFIRRLMFKNQRFLFRKRDEASGKEIFSCFPRDAPLKVFEQNRWWSDAWDPFSYGREYDTRRPFFAQFRELLFRVPLPSRCVINAVNSDFCDYVGDTKNAYLCFDGINLENSGYTVASSGLKECFDLYDSGDDERCYEGSLNDDCYRVFFSFNCEQCTDVWFSQDLTGCTNCFGCANLRNKSYYIFNTPHTKEAYLSKIKEFDTGSYVFVQNMLREAYAFWKKFPVKYMHGARNVQASGEHIQNSRNVHYCYSVHEGENVTYGQSLEHHAVDSYDYTIGGNDSALMYECVASEHQCYGLKFCWDCWPSCRELEYSAFCRSSSYLFGCVGMKKGQYCILNRQYSREGYAALREKIIRHMREMPYKDAEGRVYSYGEFFPPEFSPYAYNEAYCQDFFPLTKEKAIIKGFLWRDPETREYQATLSAADLPDRITEVPDTITQEIISCASCSGAYRIIPMELYFYRRMTIPLPRLCSNCRFFERFKFINPPRFWHRTCQCAGKGSENDAYQNQAVHFHGSPPAGGHCPNEFETSYAPERSEIVYCEPCYQVEVM